MADNDNRRIIVGEDGKRYTNPLGDPHYMVRYFDLPPEGDLGAYLRLLESFERRFLHTVDGGSEWSRHSRDADAYIADKRQEYGALHGGAKELAGAALCIALYERGLQHAKAHIKKRIAGVPDDDSELGALKSGAEACFMEASGLFDCLRRKRGRPDSDHVLAEMRGEPYKIFVGTLPGATGVLAHFHLNRQQKAAAAMRCMDQVKDAICKLTAAYQPFAEAGLTEAFQELTAAAKLRVQLPFGEAEFKETQERLVVARNKIHDFSLAPNRSPAVDNANTDAVAIRRAKRLPPQSAVGIIRDAADLIYDMAQVRGEREVSMQFLKDRVEEQMPASPHANRGMRGWGGG